MHHLILACRNEFIDLFTTLDLDEVADEYKKEQIIIKNWGLNIQILQENSCIQEGNQLYNSEIIRQYRTDVCYEYCSAYI